MPVLVIASTKGGVGKTTLARMVTATLAAEGTDFLAVDADPNRVLSRWKQNYYKGADFEMQAEADADKLAKILYEHATKGRMIVVDTAGFANQAALVAMTYADAVLVPIMADEADIDGAETTVDRVRNIANGARREIPAWVVVNAVRKGTALERHIEAELSGLSERKEIRRLDARLSHLVGYGEMSWSGVMPDRGPAKRETDALIVELKARGILPTPPSATGKRGKKTNQAAA